jgi:hypothetical protein
VISRGDGGGNHAVLDLILDFFTSFPPSRSQRLLRALARSSRARDNILGSFPWRGISFARMTYFFLSLYYNRKKYNGIWIVPQKSRLYCQKFKWVFKDCCQIGPVLPVSSETPGDRREDVSRFTLPGKSGQT